MERTQWEREGVLHPNPVGVGLVCCFSDWRPAGGGSQAPASTATTHHTTLFIQHSFGDFLGFSISFKDAWTWEEISDLYITGSNLPFFWDLFSDVKTQAWGCESFRCSRLRTSHKFLELRSEKQIHVHIDDASSLFLLLFSLSLSRCDKASAIASVRKQPGLSSPCSGSCHGETVTLKRTERRSVRVSERARVSLCVRVCAEEQQVKVK